jgi:hypothetical protein
MTQTRLAIGMLTHGRSLSPKLQKPLQRRQVQAPQHEFQPLGMHVLERCGVADALRVGNVPA